CTLSLTYIIWLILHSPSVSGSSRSISASVGEDVTLNCSVDSHITPEHIEEVSWRKTDKDEDILVLLYQNNQPLPDSSDERYRDRIEFFTAEIPKGNFSLRLKIVRTEDKGVYTCQVFAGGLSAYATIKDEAVILCKNRKMFNNVVEKLIYFSNSTQIVKLVY
uniref:Ig-like domain-containing protein n=1 Tax=Sinocyclocheilus rhinocerous TaxID=307959 RepID=A0A673FP15_9TELE